MSYRTDRFPGQGQATGAYSGSAFRSSSSSSSSGGGGGPGGGGGAGGWGTPSGPSTKDVLVGYIERACDPSLHEPNLSLDLEIADLINSKKANTPREAAVEVVRLVNHRNTHVAMLALHLLDILVKNCGYPFHLQISTKEFLNELVRRFPERPPTFPPPPMKKVLELVHEWKNTICVSSKHREDLVHIRDMHRLLSYKGYRFPDFDRRAASVLNPSENLQTADELEEEDREAQSAKLQELIRRGTPKDLAAAQELMKSLAGAEPDKKPDYASTVSKELDRIQQRVLLLNEMLNNAQPKERFVDGDAYDQVAVRCRQVQPRLQKWIAESGERDPDGMDRLLLINDLINNVINRYEAFKAGDRSATAEIDPALSSTSAAGTKAKQQAAQVSLIDFDDDDAFNAPAPDGSSSSSSAAAAPPAATSSNPLDDLASLSLGGSGGGGAASGSSGAPGGGLFDLNALYAANNTSSSSSAAPSSSTTTPNFFAGAPALVPSSSSTPSSSSPAPPAPSVSVGGGGSLFSNPAYGYSSSPSNGGSRPPSQPGTPLGQIQLGAPMGAGMAGGRSPPLPPVPPKQAEGGQKKDAFADLLGDF